MQHPEMDGPPWGTYVSPDDAYLRGQARSVGSGLLGGWSQAGYGGSFAVRPRAEADVRRTVAELVKRDRDPPADPASPQG